MNVSLIGYTQNAKELLILTKNTRHLSGETRFEDVLDMTERRKDEELSYIFSTISSSWEFVNYTFLLQDVTRSFCLEKGSKILAKKFKRKQKNNPNHKLYPIIGTKKVEEIDIGDEVWSYNEGTGEKEWDKVIFKSRHMSDDWYKIKFSNGNEITMTNEHPVYIVGRKDKSELVPRWVPAEELREGDQAIQTMYMGYHGAVRLRGKTLEESFGDEKAEKMRSAISKSSSRPYAERFGSEKRAKIEAVKRTKHMVGNTYEKICGKKKAKKLLKKRSEHLKQQHKDDPDFHSIGGKALKHMWKHNREFMIENCRMAGAKSYNQNFGRQSEPERRLEAALNKALPGEFVYNGDGQNGIIIGPRTPDFVSSNGKKKVIELFGCFWHGCKECFVNRGRKHIAKLNDKKIYKDYAKHDYDCLVIWEHELEDMQAVEEKVREYAYNPKIEIVEVIQIQRSDISRHAFNIETEKNHNFFVYGILTHNTHQLVRHRVGFSFAQQSLRVFPAESFKYFIPDKLEKEKFQLAIYDATMSQTQENYNLMLEHGVNVQDARGVLPMNICTNIIVGANLRSLSNLMETRLCVRAQGEFQMAAMLMRNLVVDVHPWAEKVLAPLCVTKGTCMFPRYDCVLKGKYKHLNRIDDETSNEVKQGWLRLMESKYSPQPEQQNKGGVEW